MKKISAILLSGLLLAACGESDTEPEDDPPEEVNDEQPENPEDKKTEENKEDEENQANEMEKTEDLKKLSEYMAKDSFVSEFGVEALENYVEIDDKLDYLEFAPDGEVANPNGSSMDEVIEAIDSVIEDAVYETREDQDEDITSISFYYFDPDESEQDDENGEVMNYADISFVFKDDNLYLSNIAPGWFNVSLDSLPDAEDLENIESIEELPEIQSNLQIFTLGKMNIDSKPAIQALTPSIVEGEGEDEESTLASYLYFIDDELVHTNFTSFFEVSEDFPISGIEAMNAFFQEYVQ